MRTAFVKNSIIAAKAYQGDAMTLLAFDLLPANARQDLVGFTIEFKNETMPAFKSLNNAIGFSAERKLRSSIEAPFQKFRWIHVLRNFSKGVGEPFFGEYQYRITPRYFTGGALVAMDAAHPKDSVTLSIDVKPFEKEGIEVAFTRGFLVSQAYTTRFGPNGNIRPKAANVVFDPATTQNDIFKKPLPADFPTTIAPYTYQDQYEWMGFYAREAIFKFIQEVMDDQNKRLDVLAYDFSEPSIAHNFLELSKQGRIRMFLDDHDKGDAEEGRKNDPTFKKQFADKFDTTTGSVMVRGHFRRLAHCKILIQKDKAGNVLKVLTGSTNFTANGICINANHILIFTQPDALKFYEKLFEASINPDPQNPFANTDLAKNLIKISNSPKISVGFSPHTSEVATAILKTVNDKISSAQKSVFFAVMELKSSGSVTKNLRELHKRDDIFTLGITDMKSETEAIKVILYQPKSKQGVLINGKKSPALMPPPFNKEVSMGLGHQVHHKFVVVDFNTPNAAVFCGSSNLAQGGEEDNGDNLLMIEDSDIATVFAIEAVRLIDHYQFRNAVAVATDNKPLTLKTDNKWYLKYFDPTDLYFLDKQVFMGGAND